MLSSEASCSDCKIEVIHNRWSKLLLKWINRCVNEKDPKIRVRRLSPKCLLYIMTKYKKDVCDDDMDRAMLCTDDIEPFIKYKYPILRLRNLTEYQDVPKKIYVMTSILLYHCCVKSQTGVVHDDICKHMNETEQEMIVKFCERLSEMEPTMNNLEVAIQDAFESVFSKDDMPSLKSSNTDLDSRRSSDTLAQMSSSSPSKCSGATLRSDSTVVDSPPSPSSPKQSRLKFASSITVLPSVVTDTSSYSDIMILDESEKNVAEKDTYSDLEKNINYTTDTKTKRESKRGEYLSEKDRDTQRMHKESEKKRQNAENIVLRHTLHSEKENITQMNYKKENVYDKEETNMFKENYLQDDPSNTTDSRNPRCLSDCSCTKCNTAGPACGDPGSNMEPCACPVSENPSQQKPSKIARMELCKKISIITVAIALLFLTIGAIWSITMQFLKVEKEDTKLSRVERVAEGRPPERYAWKCKNDLCQKVNQPANEKIFLSQSRCTLICMGPQIWPHPIGQTKYSQKLIALATSKLEYRLETISSDTVNVHLGQALKLFIGNLIKLEKTGEKFKTKMLDLDVKKMSIQIEVDSDPDPRLRLNTEEAYQIKIETINKQVVIKISSPSFCGVRHGLETLSQMILLDESTGYLITLSKAEIKDAPSYKYRGLMIDTARNYIPVKDIMRTIDAMATVKLNTFHWRISDITSFPLFLMKVPQLFEYGAYDRSMIYTKDDVKTIVKRAGVRGIRVLIEVAVPGPVGRPWIWSSGASCSTKNNGTCDNTLCISLDSRESVLNVLQTLYEEILEMTQVDDVFHLSNGVFSLSNCFNLMHNRNGLLDKILDRLKRANKGFLPKLPIIWYTSQLTKEFELKTWERYGVQLNDWKIHHSDDYLSKFRVVHSAKWDLSCEMKKQKCVRYRRKVDILFDEEYSKLLPKLQYEETESKSFLREVKQLRKHLRNWQEMYSWKSWSNVHAFTVEGGEAVLWTDLVDSGNLDYHLWPRTAAVAERLWSDIVANTTADGSVYVRLNSHRLRMLNDGVKGQAIWPSWCTYHPGPCLEKIR